MRYDTAGNQIYAPTQNCDCQLTGGCKKCRQNTEFSYPVIQKPIRKCKSCGEALGDFCSRYCKAEFNPLLNL